MPTANEQQQPAVTPAPSVAELIRSGRARVASIRVQVFDRDGNPVYDKTEKASE